MAVVIFLTSVLQGRDFRGVLGVRTRCARVVGLMYGWNNHRLMSSLCLAEEVHSEHAAACIQSYVVLPLAYLPNKLVRRSRRRKEICGVAHLSVRRSTRDENATVSSPSPNRLGALSRGSVRSALATRLCTNPAHQAVHSNELLACKGSGSWTSTRKNGRRRLT